MDLDPTPDQTPFFFDFKDAKKDLSPIFSYDLHTGTSSSFQKIKFFAKILC
jgi:hypothetical protein